MSLLPLFVCSSLKGFSLLVSPYLCFSCFSPPCWLYLCFSPPLSSMTTKVQILVRIKSINVRVKLWFNLDHLPKTCNSVWSKDKIFHTSWSIKGYLDHVELHIISPYSRFNTRLTSSQICHMLPLYQTTIETIVVPYIHQILLIFMNEPIFMQACLYVLNMSLAKYECYVNHLYLALFEERHVIYKYRGVLIFGNTIRKWSASTRISVSISPGRLSRVIVFIFLSLGERVHLTNQIYCYYPFRLQRMFLDVSDV